MKIISASFPVSARVDQRAMGSVETFLLVIGLCIGYHVASGWFNEWSGAEWTDDRVASLAAKVVTTARHAELAGLKLVDVNNLDATIDRLAAGETAENGPFVGQTYAVRDLAAERAREKVKAFLKIENGRLALLSEDERLRR